FLNFDLLDNGILIFFFSSRRRHTRFSRDWSSDVCSSDLWSAPCIAALPPPAYQPRRLQGVLLIGKSHLEGGFTLRCFQRLSLPYLATQLCFWRNNWYTSGTSIPVLSY